MARSAFTSRARRTKSPPRRKSSSSWKPAAGRPSAAPRCCRMSATPPSSAAPPSALAETGNCEIVTLRAGETPVAAGVVLRHQDRAFFFKLGVDERFAKLSPGVQLTLDLTRHLCADPAIALADSTAAPDHPMINPIWRGRLAIGDVLIPLRRQRSRRAADPGFAGAAQVDPRAGPPRRSISSGNARKSVRTIRRNPSEHDHRSCARDHGGERSRCGATFR